MVREKVIIKNLVGLHLRPAGKLCEKARQFQSSITCQTGTKTVNTKSLLALIGACIKSGDEVEFICEGADEKEALDAMITLINSGLDE